MTNHALLVRTEEKKFVVWYADGGFDDVFPSTFNMLDLCAYVLQKKISHLWVHANTKVHMLSGSIERLQSLGFDCLATYAGMNEQIANLHAYQKLERGRSPRFNIIFLEHSLWDWQNLTIPDIFEMIEDMEFNLGVPVSGSPSGTGMKYLEKVTEKRPLWLAKPDVDLSDIPWDHAARPLIWQRQPERDEIDREYLVAYDKNAAHPRAAKEEKFGYGNPTHLDECQFCPDFPGMWYLRDINPPLHDDNYVELVPPPVWNTVYGWYATPIVKLLVKMGWSFQIEEAWIFEKSAHILRGWVDNLWDLRREREGFHRDAYKSIMNDTLGLLRSDLVAGTHKFRPDWYMTVVAGTRAAMYYNLMKHALNGFYPIMVQIDALYYLTDDSNPHTAISDMLNHTNSLGGYKVKFVIPTDAVEEGLTVRAILASSLPQSRKLQLLNRIAERYGYDG